MATVDAAAGAVVVTDDPGGGISGVAVNATVSDVNETDMIVAASVTF